MRSIFSVKGIPAPIRTSWIFRNQTEWIISLSSDWTNWITIMDKNLWATQVYNDGEALTEANCWVTPDDFNK